MAEKSLKEIARERLKAARRDDTVYTFEQMYQESHKLFVQDCVKFAHDERGQKIEVSPIFGDLLKLVGSIKIATLLTSGCAQSGKTLSHLLLEAFWLYRTPYRMLYTFPNKPMLERLVATQHQPLLDKWEEAQGLEKNPSHTRSQKIWETKNSMGYWLYLSTGKESQEGTQKQGKAVAGDSLVAISVELAAQEEASQSSPAVAAPIARRMDASRLGYGINRPLGTPGGGRGIEERMAKAARQFEPHILCPHCNETVRLHPFGSLLLPDDRGEYLTSTGRPHTWLHSDPEKPIESAFFGCPKCHGKLDRDYLQNAHFRCTQTGISATDFVEGLKEPTFEVVSAWLSPVVSRNAYTPINVIRDGLYGDNSSDWCQQALGLPSTIGFSGISYESIKKALHTKPPVDKKTVVLMGIDPGRAGDAVVIKRLHYDRKQPHLQFEDAFREILFAGTVDRWEIPALAKKYKVKYGGIDNEPSIKVSVDLARDLGLVVCDQLSGKRQMTLKGTVRDGGEEFDAWKVNNDEFKKVVMLNFMDGRTCLYPEAALWFDSLSENTPLAHYLVPIFDPDTQTWAAKTKKPDHCFFADLFCEVSFYLWLTEANDDCGWIANL